MESGETSLRTAKGWKEKAGVEDAAGEWRYGTLGKNETALLRADFSRI